MVGVDVQGRLEVARHDLAVRWGEGERGSKMQFRIFRMFLKRLLKGATGQLVIAFRKRQITNRQCCADVFWIILARSSIEVVKDQLRIASKLERSAAEHHEIFRIAIRPGADAGEPVDFLQRIGRALRVVVEMENLLSHQLHTDAAGKLLQGVGGYGARLGIFATCHERANVQHTWILLPLVFLRCLDGVGNRACVIALCKSLLRLLQGVCRPQCGGGDQQAD